MDVDTAVFTAVDSAISVGFAGRFCWSACCAFLLPIFAGRFTAALLPVADYPRTLDPERD
jgi:hypothetical protein